MGNRHGSYDDTDGQDEMPAATPEGVPHAMPAELDLRAALECEAEGWWVERQLEDGRLVERLTSELRAAALAAFDDGIAAEGAAEGAAEDAVLADLLEETLGIEAASEATAALRPTARANALAAWDAHATAAAETAEAAAAPVLRFPERSTSSAQPARAGRRAPRAEPLRAKRMQAPLLMRPFAAAALLLVALGAGMFFFGGGEEAEAGLQLRALSRRNLASTIGMSQIEPGYFASLGRVYAPGEDELLSFGFAYEGLVVVGAGDAVRVTRPGTRVDRGPGAAPIVLRLESGEARLATREAPIPLEVDGVGLLVLEEGAAHVALHAESPGGAPAVALAERSVARFHRADGTSVPLSGPTRVLLTADGVRSFGTPARSLFRELAFFGGPLPATTQVRSVSARLFEVRAGEVRRGRQDVRVLASTPQAAASAQVAWRPPPVLADARRVRVALRAPVGTTVALAQEGGEALVAHVEHVAGSTSSEPGVATVELALEQGWYDRLPAGRLELTIAVPAAGGNPATTTNTNTTTSRRKPVRAWFDGISLVLGAAEDRLPNAVGSASSDGTKSVPDAAGGR